MNAKELFMKSFAHHPMERTAAENIVLDSENKPCGLLIVELPIPDCKFEGNIVGKPNYSDGQYFIYLPDESSLLKITCPGYKPLLVDLVDVDNNPLIKYKQTYHLVIEGYEDIEKPQKPNESLKTEIKQSTEVEKPALVPDEAKTSTSMPPAQKKSVKSDFGSLEIAFLPDSAEIFIDDVKVGTTPAIIDNIAKGKHILKITFEDYFDFIKEVDVKRNKTTKITGNLTPLDEAALVKKRNAIKAFENSIIRAFNTKHYQECYEQAMTNRNNPIAQYFIGRCYEDGYVVRKSMSEARKWYMLAADQNLAAAQNSLGLMYYNGKGVEKDPVEAARWYTLAAELDDPAAQSNLGMLYYKGDGVPQDYEKALELYHKAAEAGNTAAQNNIGFCYFNGEGVPQSYTEAVEWYTKAAESGNAQAQNNLGRCYNEGLGVEVNQEKAFNWFRESARQNVMDAKYNLALCYYYGEGTEKDYEAAFVRFKEVAGSDNTSAQYYLGYCYMAGRGTDVDMDAAVHWLRIAARKGHQKAQIELKRLEISY